MFKKLVNGAKDKSEDNSPNNSQGRAYSSTDSVQSSDSKGGEFNFKIIIISKKKEIEWIIFLLKALCRYSGGGVLPLLNKKHNCNKCSVFLSIENHVISNTMQI